MHSPSLPTWLQLATGQTNKMTFNELIASRDSFSFFFFPSFSLGHTGRPDFLRFSGPSPPSTHRHSLPHPTSRLSHFFTLGILSLQPSPFENTHAPSLLQLLACGSPYPIRVRPQPLEVPTILDWAGPLLKHPQRTSHQAVKKGYLASVRLAPVTLSVLSPTNNN
jgi:hypothetical protein